MEQTLFPQAKLVYWTAGTVQLKKRSTLKLAHCLLPFKLSLSFFILQNSPENSYFCARLPVSQFHKQRWFYANQRWPKTIMVGARRFLVSVSQSSFQSSNNLSLFLSGLNQVKCWNLFLFLVCLKKRASTANVNGTNNKQNYCLLWTHARQLYIDIAPDSESYRSI